jgi:hypothetical protein
MITHFLLANPIGIRQGIANDTQINQVSNMHCLVYKKPLSLAQKGR